MIMYLNFWELLLLLYCINYLYVCIVFSNGHVLLNLSGVRCVNIMNTIVMSFHCIITYYLMLCNRYWVLFGIDQCVYLIILLLCILLCLSLIHI